jgi:hypothetical protein
LTALAVGCDAKSDTAGASTSAASASPPAATSASNPSATAAAPAPPPPDDLDLAAAQKALKCATDAKSGVCGVLAKWSKCSPWSGQTPSGDGRYFGRGYAIEAGKTTELISVFRVRNVPLADVGPGQVGAKIAIGELKKEEGAAFDQAGRGIQAFERGDIPQRGSPTIDYLRKRTDWVEAFASKTAGGQVYVIREGGAFVCSGARQTLLLVQRAATRGGQGDGLYAELWPATW